MIGSAPEALGLLHRDQWLAVFDKASGLLVHRGWGADRLTALDTARRMLRQYVWPVHRLDRATSGVLMFALDPQTAALLQSSFQSGLVCKRYLALVRGTPPEHGPIDCPLPRENDRNNRVPAVTDYRRLFSTGRVSLVEACPRTGRMHQLRRHFKHIRHPIVGDVNYGSGELNRLFRTDYDLHRLALHAIEMHLPHPHTGEPLHFAAAVPSDLASALRRLAIPDEHYCVRQKPVALDG